MFAVTWAWVNFSWFASAYDTDDWIYRLTTMVQMVGVLILALGLPDMFESLLHGDHLDIRVMVLGYVVMRVPMIAQWARASRQDPDRVTVCRVFIVTILVSQTAWIVLELAETSIAVTFAWMVALMVLEMVGPVMAEHLPGGTPWHAHHIAERYGLLFSSSSPSARASSAAPPSAAPRSSRPRAGPSTSRCWACLASG